MQQLAPLTFVGYLRCSTEGRGQDPLRQKDVIQAWQARTGHNVVAWVVDEGTSGAVDPFQRQKVREAIDLVDEHKATGIVVEAIDRWTRGGVEALSVSRFFLRLDHDVRLVVANTPEGLTLEMEEMWDSMMATVARMFRTRLREQVKSGLARAKAKGWPKGRPGRKAKPLLTEAEMALVRGMIMEEGQGVDKVALELSKCRGAWDVADRKKAEFLTVKPTWLWEQIHALLPDTAACLNHRARGAALAAKRPVRAAMGENRAIQKRRSHRTGQWLANMQVAEPGAKA